MNSELIQLISLVFLFAFILGGIAFGFMLSELRTCKKHGDERDFDEAYNAQKL